MFEPSVTIPAFAPKIAMPFNQLWLIPPSTLVQFPAVLLHVCVPAPAPGASVAPAATVVAPAIDPDPPSVAPEATVVAVLPSDPLTKSVPVLTDVAPV